MCAAPEVYFVLQVDSFCKIKTAVLIMYSSCTQTNNFLSKVTDFVDMYVDIYKPINVVHVKMH